jgi:putative heme iron utilization protein
MAEHGRNLAADPRASLLVTGEVPADDPLDAGRVTLAGHAVRAEGAGADEARAAYLAAVPYAARYLDFADFALWVLRVERVRWVGGYGRMETVDPGAYRSAP